MSWKKIEFTLLQFHRQQNSHSATAFERKNKSQHNILLELATTITASNKMKKKITPHRLHD